MQPASYQDHSSSAYTQIAQLLILKKPARRERVAETERIARRGRFTAPTADLSARIGINLRIIPSASVGARAAGMWMGGPLWSPVVATSRGKSPHSGSLSGGTSVNHKGPRPTGHPASCLSPKLRTMPILTALAPTYSDALFVRLMPITADLSALVP